MESKGWGFTRRRILKMSGGAIFMPSLSSSIRDFFLKALPVRTVEKTRFRFDADSGAVAWDRGAREPYSLTVDGLVRDAKTFSYTDLTGFARVEQVSDFHCVEGWSVRDLAWGGFRFGEIVARVNPLPGATHVLFHSLGMTGSSPRGQGHYIESLPLAELLDPAREILLALFMNGKPLPEDHGAPLRLITPFDLAYKSSKCIRRMEFLGEARPGWWTLANPAYPVEARVPKSRLRRAPGR